MVENFVCIFSHFRSANFKIFSNQGGGFQVHFQPFPGLPHSWKGWNSWKGWKGWKIISLFQHLCVGAGNQYHFHHSHSQFPLINTLIFIICTTLTPIEIWFHSIPYHTKISYPAYGWKGWKIIIKLQNYCPKRLEIYIFSLTLAGFSIRTLNCIFSHFRSANFNIFSNHGEGFCVQYSHFI